MNFLTLSLSGVAFAYVENANSAKECWDDLLEEYEPKGDMDAYDLAEEFTKCVLQDKLENPTLWFKRLEYINQRLRAISTMHEKDDEALKIHVKANLPKQVYSVLLTSIRNEFKSMTFRKFKSEIKQHWRSIMREKERKDDFKKTDEQIFVMNSRKSQYYKQFKGSCNKCGEFGHKAKDCPQKKRYADVVKERGFNKSKVKYWKCGKLVIMPTTVNPVLGTYT